MVWDVNRGGQVLTPDESIVLDHVSGLSSVLASSKGQPCPDRAIVGELMAMRAKVGSLAISAPRLRLSFEQVMQAAQEASPSYAGSGEVSAIATGANAYPNKEGRIIYWLTTRWGIGLVTAASVAVAFITGVYLVSENLEVQYSAPQGDMMAIAPAPEQQSEPGATSINSYMSHDEASPAAVVPAVPNLVRSGSIHLRHADPSSIQQRVTDLVTSQGGAVTNLTRTGTGIDTNIHLEVAVPANNWRAFLNTVAALGEVVGQSESADEVTGQKIDLTARLAEARDYLKRLDTLAEKSSANLHEAQSLERERRETRREIERLSATLEALENRIALSRLTVRVSAGAASPEPEPKGEFARAWQDGLTGLEKLSAFGLKAGVAGSPLLAGGALVYLLLRHKRRKETAAAGK